MLPGRMLHMQCSLERVNMIMQGLIGDQDLAKAMVGPGECVLLSAHMSCMEG